MMLVNPVDMTVTIVNGALKLCWTKFHINGPVAYPLDEGLNMRFEIGRSPEWSIEILNSKHFNTYVPTTQNPADVHSKRKPLHTHHPHDRRARARCGQRRHLPANARGARRQRLPLGTGPTGCGSRGWGPTKGGALQGGVLQGGVPSDGVPSIGVLWAGPIEWGPTGGSSMTARGGVPSKLGRGPIR